LSQRLQGHLTTGHTVAALRPKPISYVWTLISPPNPSGSITVLRG